MNTGDFPTVGDSVLSYVGSGGICKPSKGKMVAKNVMGRGASPTGTTGNRSSYKIQEANGPRCSIQTTLYKANAAEASQVQRNVRILPSAAGTGDFFKARQLAGTVY